MHQLVRLIHQAAVYANRQEADVLDRLREQLGKEDMEAWNALLSSASRLRVEALQREQKMAENENVILPLTTEELAEQTRELEWLRYFYRKADSAMGPASSDIYDMLKEEYVETGGVLPAAYQPEDESKDEDQN